MKEVIALSQRQKETLSLFIDRILSDEKPGSFSDGEKISLAIPGGGMAGVISGGAMTAFHDTAILVKELQTNGGDFKAAVKELRRHQINYNETENRHLGKLHYFDSLWACSSGIWIGAYALAGEPYNGGAVIFEDFNRKINGRTFLSIPRGLLHYIAKRLGMKNTRPGMDLGFVEYIVTGQNGATKALNINRVMESNVPFHIVVTDLDEMARKALLAKTPEEFFQNAMSGSFVAGAAGIPPKDRPRYVDANIVGSSPVGIIPKDHRVIVASADPIGKPPEPKGLAAVFEVVLVGSARIAVKDRKEMKELWNLYLTEMRKNYRDVRESQNDDRFVYFGASPGKVEVTNVTSDRDKLRKAKKKAYSRTMNILRDVMLEKGLIRKNENEPVRMPYRWRKGLNPASSTHK